MGFMLLAFVDILIIICTNTCQQNKHSYGCQKKLSIIRHAHVKIILAIMKILFKNMLLGYYYKKLLIIVIMYYFLLFTYRNSPINFTPFLISLIKRTLFIFKGQYFFVCMLNILLSFIFQYFGSVRQLSLWII